MLFFLFGEDDFRAIERKKEIIAHFQKPEKNIGEVVTFTKENLSFEEFTKVLQRRSLFVGTQIIILEDIFSSLEFKEKFLREQEKILSSKNLILILERGEKFKKEDPLFLFLKDNAKCEKFSLLSGRELRAWIQERAKKYNLSLKKEIIEKLIELKGNNLWEIDQELRKISLYGRGKATELKDLENLVSFTSEENVFEIIEAVLKKDKKRGIFLLNSFWQKGLSPLLLLAILTSCTRKLLIIKEFLEKKESYLSISKKIKINPFFFRKLYLCAKKFSLGELKKIQERFFQIEFEIKTGRGEALTLFTLFFAHLG